MLDYKIHAIELQKNDTFVTKPFEIVLTFSERNSL